MCIVIQISSKPFITQREVGDIDLSFVHTCVYILPPFNIYVFFNCPLSDILAAKPSCYTNILCSSFCGIILQLRLYNPQKFNFGWVWNWIFVMYYCLSLITEMRQYIFYLTLTSLDVIPDHPYIMKGKFLHHWFLWCICYKSPSNL